MTDKSDMQAHETPVPRAGWSDPELAADRSARAAAGTSALRIPWGALTLFALLALSAWFRLSNLGTASLTHEEAWRANVAFGVDPVISPRRLPPLQFVMGWLIQHALGRTELALRTPYALAGVGCVVLVYLFVRRHIDSRSALLAAAVAGAHPVLVTCSRKAKVFSLEALLAIALLWVGLEAYRRRSARSLRLFMVVGVLGLGLTFSSSLLICAWMPLLAGAVLRRDQANPRPLRAFLVTAAVLALVGAAWYLWLAGAPNRATLIQYQGAKLGMWPDSYTPAALGSWLFSKSYGLLRYVLGMSGVWEPLNWCLGVSGVFAAAASAGVLWRRARPLCVFAAILAVGVVNAAALRFWPIGENQTVTFLVPLSAIAIGCGLGEFARRMGRSPATAMLFCLCILVPTARATKATLFPAPFEQHLRPVFAYAASRLQPGDAVFIHYETSDAYGFYWRDTGHPTLCQPGDDRDNVRAFAARFDAWIAEHPRVWFVFMLRRPAETGPWMKHIRRHHHVRDEHRCNDAAVYLIERGFASSAAEIVRSAPP